MLTTSHRLCDLTAADVMTRDVVTILRSMSLPDAARLLRHAGLTAAPVVDEQGACVGVLSAGDFLLWIEQGCPDATEDGEPCYLYQNRGRLLTGEPAVICTRAEGTCSLQSIRPTTAGRHTTVCLRPCEIFSDWQVSGGSSGGGVSRYMKPDIALAGPETPVSELARVMIDAHIHRVVILDGRGRPVGVVSSIDILTAVLP